MARRYEDPVEQAYARANRASHRAAEARSRAMASPRNPALHRNAAKLFRAAGRLYLKAGRISGRSVDARVSADRAFDTAVWHDDYARKIGRGEMGAPGSSHEYEGRARKARGGRPARDSTAASGASARKAAARVNKLLSQAQDIIGRELATAEFRRSHPVAFKRADDAYTHIERARRSLTGTR